MDPGDICREAIRGCSELPPRVRERSDYIRNFEWSEFDQTYLDFLDEQISLEARGPTWSERLLQRKQNCIALVDTKHLNCCLEDDGLIWHFKITPDPPKVIHFEHYSYGTESIG
jgi:hypothetical protein